MFVFMISFLLSLLSFHDLSSPGVCALFVFMIYIRIYLSLCVRDPSRCFALTSVFMIYLLSHSLAHSLSPIYSSLLCVFIIISFVFVVWWIYTERIYSYLHIGALAGRLY